MSGSKHFDKICCVVLCFTLLLTILFMNGTSLGISAAANTMGYESRLFDTSKVHTIDIVMDDWEGFLETCTNEEYVMCSVVIDGEAYKNVGIRAKGNTSLSSVASYGNNRYSFKIEFDQYDNTKSYYGLDKLSLNNIIQDTTYMKDYLVYQMMGQFGVAAPLCSYAYITVNGEDFGLYLAVEAVEDGFLTRNYGTNYGDLYKPDSMSMGGGRGNGKDFDREDMESIFEGMGDMNPFGSSSDNSSEDSTDTDSSATPDMSQFGGGMGGMQMPDMSRFGGGMGGMQMPDMSQFGGGMGGFGGFGGNDVSLVYSDDDHDSYSNIFNNAKTTVTDADKARLIASIKQMNEGTDIEDVVNVEEVIRYFVVHNFAVNFDSYTGSMIHNYYLYEKDGKMEMIPWDYNLAFGTFQGSSNATSLVNYPIDTPVSGGNVDSRPMLAWIFADEEYTELYHEYFAEFLAMFYENGTLTEMIDNVSAMIAPYIEKQPTEFYSYEEFQTGVETMKEFCTLRLESIKGQLAGTIPATSSGQSADSASLIDGSHINVSSMGSFGGGGGFGGGMSFPGGSSFDRNDREQHNSTTDDTSTDGTGKTGGSRKERPTTKDTPEDSTSTVSTLAQNGGGMTFPGMNGSEMPDMSQFGGGMTFPGMDGSEMPDMSQFGGGMSFPGMDGSEGDNNSSTPEDTTPSSGNSGGKGSSTRPSSSSSGFDRGSMSGGSSSGNTQNNTNLVLLGISVLVLAGGLAFAILYGRKRF